MCLQANYQEEQKKHPTMVQSGEGRYRTKSDKCKAALKDNILVIFLILAVILGICIAIGVRSIWTDPINDPLQRRQIFILKFPGDLLMNMLKLLILPLIMTSLISAMAGLDQRASGWMGFRAVLYYLSTTLIAVIIGIILVLSIRPGEKGQAAVNKGTPKNADGVYSLLDLIRNCFPPNLIEACFQKESTIEVDEKLEKMAYNFTNKNDTISSASRIVVCGNKTEGDYWSCEVTNVIKVPSITDKSGMNVLGIVVFSIAFGCTIARMGEKGLPLYRFFDAACQAIMLLVKVVIWYSPIGIMFLIAAKLIEMEDLSIIVEQLGYYTLTVLAGLAVHGFIILPLIYFITVRRNPYLFMYRMLKALLTAWATASSSATLPVTYECLVEGNKIDERVVKFVAPVGATINMDGTALYEAVASIFIAQMTGVTLTVGEVITVSLTATAAAIGAAGVPQAGLVTMAIVLTAVGLNPDDMTMILAIDWFLDRFRTAINVLGDSYGAGIVAKYSKGDLARMDRQEQLPLDDTSHLANSSGSIHKTPPAFTNEGYTEEPAFTKL